MNRWLMIGVVLVAGLVAGCGDRDRNINRDRDRPRSSGEKIEAPKPGTDARK
jgi:hypothetical protein